MLKIIAVALAVLIYPPFAHAQAINIMVKVTAKDPVGLRLATSVRESFASSPLFKLVFNEDDAAIKVSLVTLDPDSEAGSRTIYSQVITIPNPKGLDHYLISGVGTCGLNKVRSCADSIKADVDEQLNIIREALRNQK